MDRFFLEDNNIDIGYISNKEDIKHISKVLRLKPGDKIEIVDKAGMEYICELKDVSSGSIEYDVISKSLIKREFDIRYHLYQGIPKGSKMDTIVQKLTELGIYSITPVSFSRCVAEISEQKEEKKVSRLQRVAYEAAKQSKRLIIPHVKNPVDIKGLIKELEDNDVNIIFYEDEKNITIKDIVQDIKDKNPENIGLIIGPEGGITKEEAELLKKHGCITASLGSRILRTETAPLAALSILSYELG